MMRSEPRFVTPSMFLNYWGVNLNRLKDTDQSGNKENMFLMQVEDRILTWVDSKTFRNVSWDHLTSFQTECLQKAILTQAMYIIKNSDFGLDSGIDPEKGTVINFDDIQRAEISPRAIDFLKICGLYNLTLKNRIRYIDFM